MCKLRFRGNCLRTQRNDQKNVNKLLLSRKVKSQKMWKKFDKHSAIYHTHSKIENFQFSLTLRTISSLLKVPKFEKASSEDEDSADEEDHIEKVTIRWQEKILSRHEVEFYKEIENCTTDVQKTYHNWIKREEPDERRKDAGKIFTYVHEDNFTLHEDLLQGATPGRIGKSPDNHEEAEEMYVFADLSPDTLLFTVKWFSSEGMLLVYPDFNDFERSPYFIEIDTDYRHLYSYAVRNVSKTMTMSLLDNLRLPKIAQPERNVQALFDMLPKHSTRASLLFEIQEGLNFEYDSIHVRYQFEIPDRIQLEDGISVGSTHGSKSLNGSWKFGHCLQFTIICAENIAFQKPINAFFEVISIDSWERERNEGFCHLQIPITAGKVQQGLRCYRVNYGFLERIERFFIGGRRKFKFKEFNEGSEGFLNRYGSKAISTGLLHVQYSILLQKCPEFPLASNDKRKWSGMTLDDIRKAYQEARRRLEATISN